MSNVVAPCAMCGYLILPTEDRCLPCDEPMVAYPRRSRLLDGRIVEETGLGTGIWREITATSVLSPAPSEATREEIAEVLDAAVASVCVTWRPSFRDRAVDALLSRFTITRKDG